MSRYCLFISGGRHTYEVTLIESGSSLSSLVTRSAQPVKGYFVIGRLKNVPLGNWDLTRNPVRPLTGHV